MDELQSTAETLMNHASRSCIIKDVFCEDMYLFVMFRNTTNVYRKLISVFFPCYVFMFQSSYRYMGKDFPILLESIRDKVFRFARRNLNDPEDARNAVQDVFGKM
jgi:hypothetical protein